MVFHTSNQEVFECALSGYGQYREMACITRKTMRSKLWICFVFLAIWGLWGATADADEPGISMTGYSFNAANNVHFTLGYLFDVTQPITVTALGSIDFGGTSIAGTGSRPVTIYYSTNPPQAGGPADGHTSGDAVPGASATVLATDPIFGLDGGAYTSGDGFRYHTLASPVTLDTGTYEIMTVNLGTGYAMSWTGIGNASGVSAPLVGTYSSTPTDTVSYGTSVEHWGPAENSIGGLAGPNFLVGVPEPSGVGVVALVCAGLVRRRLGQCR